MSKQSVSDYNREYYKQHKEEISRRRRDKYRNDPAYRARMLAREQAWREKKKQERFESARAVLEAVPVFDLSAAPHRETMAQIDGQACLLVSSSALAAALGIAVRTLTSWLEEGRLPPAEFHTEVCRKDGVILRRWFSTGYVQKMYELHLWLCLGREVFFNKVRERFGAWDEGA